MKAVIFDFDGVIHDTFELAYGIVEKIAPSCTREDYRKFFDGNILQAVASKFSNAERDEFRKLESELFESLIVDRIIKEQIQRLYEKFDMYIISSNTSRNIARYLERNGLAEMFKDVIACEAGQSKTLKFEKLFSEYDLTADTCIFVTDTLGDIREAHSISVRTIACTFGFHDRERLIKAKPFRVASSFLDVAEILEAMGSC